MKKRLLTVLLAVILVAALGTVTAWAEERMVVAKIGDETYTSLGAATAAVENGETIVLQGNYSQTSSDLVVGSVSGEIKSFNLDLNGYTLSSTGMVLDLYNVDLTIMNGTVQTSYEGTAAIWCNNGAALTIANNAEVIAADNSFGIGVYGTSSYYSDNVKIVVDGKLSGANGLTINGNITQEHSDNISVDINGTIDVSGVGLYLAGYGVTNVSSTAKISGNTGIEIRSGDLVVDGATITGGETFAIQANGSGSTTSGAGIAVSQHTTQQPINVNIISGEITGAVAFNEANPQNNGEDKTEQISISITGGEFTSTEEGKDAVESATQTGFITGGTFKDSTGSSSDISKYLPEGAALGQNDSGEIVTDEAVAVAEINGVPYTSLGAAIADVENGDIITVTKDIPNAIGISVPEGSYFTIDFGDHTYTLSAPGAGSKGTETSGFQFLKNSNVTLRNGTIRIAEGNASFVPTEDRKPIMRIIQNYANLTLDDMHIYAENQYGGEDYTISLNFGSIHFKGDTDVITTSNDTIAFDVYFWDNAAYSDGLDVTFDDDYTGTINGIILYDSKDPQKAKLTVNGYGYIGDIDISASTSKGQTITVTGGTFGTSVADVADTPDYE